MFVYQIKKHHYLVIGVFFLELLLSVRHFHVRVVVFAAVMQRIFTIIHASAKTTTSLKHITLTPLCPGSLSTFIKKKQATDCLVRLYHLKVVMLVLIH